MVMLARFVPWGVRDVEFDVLEPARGQPLSRGALVARAGVGALATLLVGLAGVALVGGLSAIRAGRGFAVLPALLAVVRPSSVGEWSTTVGLLVLAALGGLATAATLVARRGVTTAPAEE